MAKISGGEKLEARLKELAQKVTNPGTLRAGFLEGATYADGTSVAMVAALNDFGVPAHGQPPRPFFRNTVAAGKKTWGKAIEKILKATDWDATRTLNLMGEQIRGEIVNSIINGSYAPLAPSTVARKGFKTPLISTATMLHSVAYEVN